MFKKIGIILSSFLVASAVLVGSAYAATTDVNVNFRSAPSLQGTVTQVVPKGQYVEVLGYANDNWINVDYNGQVGYMSTKYTIVTPQEDTALNIIAYGEGLIGTTHYLYGANQAPALFDCSSYMKYIFSQNGIYLRRTSREQATQGTYVAKENLMPGDLVFFTVGSATTIGHVGVYVGNGMFLNNAPSSNGPRLSHIDTGYWNTHYVTARRVIQ